MHDLTGEDFRQIRPAAIRPLDRDFESIAADLPFQPRTRMPELPPDQRRSGFTEVALGLDEAQAQAEAKRCLQCGGCAQCLACVPACAANQAIRHDQTVETTFENAGVVIVADPRPGPGDQGR